MLPKILGVFVLVALVIQTKPHILKKQSGFAKLLKYE